MTKPRILVIRGGAIGDFILTLPAIKLLREAFPKAHLEILGYEHIVALAEGRFYADSARSIEYGAMAGFFVPNGTLETELMGYFASFQQIVSYLFDPDGIFESNLRRAGAKNIIMAYSRIDDSEHAAHQLARPLQQLALYLEEAGAEIYPSEKDRAAAMDVIGKAGERPLLAVHPGSGSLRKNWPVERWIDLLQKAVKMDARPMIALVGGEADREQVGAIAAKLEGQCLPLQDLPLPVLAAVLNKCCLFLGHDSGISHLAAAANTPCVLLFGPTDPEIWAPANQNVEIVHAPEGDLAQLDAECVWEKISVRF